MAEAKQLPSGAWRVLVYAGKDENGKRQYKSFTAPTKRKAELAALEWQEHYKEVCRDKSNMTLREAIDKHIEEIRPTASPATLRGYRTIQKNRLVNMIDKQLKKITQADIDKAKATELSERSIKTAHNTFGLFKTIMSKYRPDFMYELTLPEPYPTIQEVPMDNELAKIYEQIKNTEGEIPFLLAAWLGLRASEIRGLKMSNIKDDYIIIQEAIVDGEGNEAFKKKTKTRTSTRVLPLPKFIKERIEVMVPSDAEYVTRLSGTAMYKRFRRACEKAGVGSFRFHDLRHSTASIMLDENIPDKYVAEYGGWGTNIFKVRYQHTNATRKAIIYSTVNKRFEKIMQHEMQHDNSDTQK